jgi:hypothetical protein
MEKRNGEFTAASRMAKCIQNRVMSDKPGGKAHRIEDVPTRTGRPVIQMACGDEIKH